MSSVPTGIIHRISDSSEGFKQAIEAFLNHESVDVSPLLPVSEPVIGSGMKMPEPWA